MSSQTRRLAKVAGCLPPGLSFWVAAHPSAVTRGAVVMVAPTRVSRNVSVSVSLRRADRRLSKAVSAQVAVLLAAVCRVTAATAISGGCCRAF